MRSSVAAFTGLEVVVKSCAQSVSSVLIPQDQFASLFTTSTHSDLDMGTNDQVYPTTLHKFVMQFYSAAKANLTEVCKSFSTLSTPLIIRSTPANKEFLVIRQGG